MVTRNKTAQAGAGKNKGRVKVGKLKLNKETVRDLSKHEGKDIRGGQADSIIPGHCTATCRQAL